MMNLIENGRRWEINSIEDYNTAVETLEGNKFCAMMSDDYYRSRAELEEYEIQLADVTAQAKAKGII